MSKLSSAVAQRELSPYERFRNQFERLRPEIAALVGREKVDKFMRVALNAVQDNPDVLTADRRSLFLACMEAAQDGLVPDGREAVFNVYPTKNKERSKAEGRDVWEDIVQYLPMVYGLIQLIYEAGATYVDAVAVYEKDHFVYQRGDEPKIDHKPYDGMEDPGKVKAAYVVVKMATGETKREVMFRRDIEKVRAKSKNPNGLMWKEDGGFYDQGAIKSVIHRIFKQLPAADRLARALAKDNAKEGLAEVPVSDQATGVADLAALVDGRLDQEMRTVRPTTVREPVNAGGGEVGEPVRTGTTAAQANAPSETERPAAPERKADAQSEAGERAAAADRPRAPKPGDPGTPELKERYLTAFKASTDPEILGLKFDETTFYSWSEADAKDLRAAYDARQKELADA